MRNTRRITRAVRHPVLSAVVLAVMLAGSPAVTFGEENEDQAGPLVLKAQGSFFVGGEIIHTDAVSGTPGGRLGGGNEGSIAVNQMYVQYQIPQRSNHLPVVLIHGGDLAGTCWETTPDGRMGWNEYFARNGRAVYIPDQISRARSGFDATRINEVRLGIRPASELPSIFVAPEELAWTVFRFGPTFGVPYPDTQFPVEAADQLARQVIPDQNDNLPTPNPNWANLAALGKKLGGAILVGHSQSSSYPTHAALTDPTSVRGIIQLETGCLATLAPDQIEILAKIPILLVVADHMNAAQPPASCVQEMAQINGAGGDMTFDLLPALGLHGNSHMMMQDKNNLQVADILLRWIDEHVEGNH